MSCKFNRVPFVLMFFLCFTTKVSSQELGIMTTYSQTDLIYSPGIEVNYFWRDVLGIELGISALLFNYKPDQLVNHIDSPDDYNSLFYNANLGLCGFLYKYKQLKIGCTIGWKVYYAPDFVPIHFYEEGGYYIYSDASGKDVLNHSLDHGIDMGMSLYLNKFIIGLKYDTARNQLRFLAGWSFRLPK